MLQQHVHEAIYRSIWIIKFKCIVYEVFEILADSFAIKWQYDFSHHFVDEE